MKKLLKMHRKFKMQNISLNIVCVIFFSMGQGIHYYSLNTCVNYSQLTADRINENEISKYFKNVRKSCFVFWRKVRKSLEKKCRWGTSTMRKAWGNNLPVQVVIGCSVTVQKISEWCLDVYRAWNCLNNFAFGRFREFDITSSLSMWSGWQEQKK